MQFPRRPYLFVCGASPISVGRAEFLNALVSLGYIGNWQFKSSYDAVCPIIIFIYI